MKKISQNFHIRVQKNAEGFADSKYFDMGFKK